MRLVMPESLGPRIATTRDALVRSILDASPGVSISAPGSAIPARLAPVDSAPLPPPSALRPYCGQTASSSPSTHRPVSATRQTGLAQIAMAAEFSESAIRLLEPPKEALAI